MMSLLIAWLKKFRKETAATEIEPGGQEKLEEEAMNAFRFMPIVATCGALDFNFKIKSRKPE